MANKEQLQDSVHKNPEAVCSKFCQVQLSLQNPRRENLLSCCCPEPACCCGCTVVVINITYVDESQNAGPRFIQSLFILNESQDKLGLYICQV